MRLNCPNCGAEYEVPEGMVPAAGRHVQCTACHTRWFVRGGPGAGLTEDQILRRLESWSPGTRPMPAPAPVALVPAAAPDTAPDTAPAPQPEAQPAESPVVVHLPPRPATPPKPAERPAVSQPAPLSAPPRPQPASRLELGEPAAPAAELPPPSRSRFARGFLLALLLAALALAAYLYRAPIAAQVPQAAPALTAYGEAVDHWRGEIEKLIGDPDR